MCAIFVLCQHHPLHQLHSEYEGGYRFMHKLWWYLKANGYERPQIRHRFPFSEEFGKIESYHLYLIYYPYILLKKNLSQIDANGFSQIEIGFETEGPRLEVTKYGVRLILKQDIEDRTKLCLGAAAAIVASLLMRKI